MKIALACLALVAPLAIGPASVAKVALAGTGLCRAGEAVIFACRTGRTSVAVCVGAAGAVQYRAGRAGRLDLVSPSGSHGLSYANRAYSGGGESQVRFVNGDYRYIVYSGMYRTGFGPDGLNYPKFESGVFVRKGGLAVSTRRCLDPDDAILNLTLAETHLPEGDFEDHD